MALDFSNFNTDQPTGGLDMKNFNTIEYSETFLLLAISDNFALSLGGKSRRFLPDAYGW